MSDRNLSGSIALTKLKHVLQEQAGANGPVKVLVIPIDANMLTEKDGAIYMQVNVKVKEETDAYGQNGFISKTTDSKIYKALDEAGKALAKELSPILGSIKDFSAGSANDTAGAAAEGVLKAEDKLPF